jgi:hypothetical protein
MAPQVKKAKTAFMFYQADQLAKIRAELGGTTSMGEAMTEVRNTTSTQHKADSAVQCSDLASCCLVVPVAITSHAMPLHFCGSFFSFFSRRLHRCIIFISSR